MGAPLLKSLYIYVPRNNVPSWVFWTALSRFALKIAITDWTIYGVPFVSKLEKVELFINIDDIYEA